MARSARKRAAIALASTVTITSRPAVRRRPESDQEAAVPLIGGWGLRWSKRVQ